MKAYFSWTNGIPSVKVDKNSRRSLKPGISKKNLECAIANNFSKIANDFNTVAAHKIKKAKALSKLDNIGVEISAFQQLQLIRSRHFYNNLFFV